MKKIHYSICPDHEHHQAIVQLSLDGVLESKSSLNSLDTYSVQFKGCRTIYPIRIIKPCERFKYDEEEQFRQVLKDLNDNEIMIECGVFDKIKRSFVNCIKGHSSKFPCEYCENCAVPYIHCNKRALSAINKKYDLKEKKIMKEIMELEKTEDRIAEIEHLREKINEITKEKEKEMKEKGRTRLTWPSSTMTGNLRTVEGITAIVEEIESNPDILKTDPDFCKGIKGRSLMLDQPSFNMIEDVPCEYMHLLCFGVVKRMITLNFKVGEQKDRITTRKLTLPSLFNEKIKSIKVTREFSRRCRNMDLSVWKASEYKHCLIFFFPIILDCIEEDFEDDRKIWLHLVYMIRACILPNEEFRKIDTAIVESACKNFYELFEKLFGEINCTYSIHVLPSHLLKIRGNNPLTYRSAFKFESFFSEMRNLFQPGTISPVKQILNNCYMKRLLEYHYCQKKVFFGPQKSNNTGKENNSLIYCYNENETITIYSIAKQIDEHSFSCVTQGKFRVSMSLTPEYDWSAVGVFRAGPLSEKLTVVMKHDIIGKVLNVNGYLITCPINVLLEQ